MPITRQLLKQSWRSWYDLDLRRAGPLWLHVLWTVLAAAVAGLLFTVLGVTSHNDWAEPTRWWRWYRVNFVISLAVTLSIHAMFAISIAGLTRERIRRLAGRQRGLYFVGVPMLGVLTGWPLGMWLVSGDVAGWVRISGEQLLGSASLALFINAIFFMLYSSRARRLTAEKRAAEAQLRLLQAQIEPHFLFNTLANVQSLMDHDLPKAKHMLTAFTDYLRASLGTLRSEDSCVSQELELAQHYLQLMQGRMEDRLRFSIDANDAARALPLPPLLLQPLVENAIVHGLEPSIEGGTVHVSATIDGKHLRLEVRDTGLGTEAPSRAARSGAGIALANIRERLAARYGHEAMLELLPASPGTLARITLPLQLP